MGEPVYVVTNAIVLVIGIICGTQLAWYIQLLLLAGGWAYLNHMAPKLEMAIILLMIPYIAFVVGLIIGDISWLLQTGAGGTSFGSFLDLFIAK